MAVGELRLLPNGHLVWEGFGGDVPAKVAKGFGESVEAGILALGTEGMGVEGLSASLGFWRDFCGAYLTRLCASPPTGDGGEWVAVPLPGGDELEGDGGFGSAGAGDGIFEC